MTHTYANTDTFKDWLRDNWSAEAGGDLDGLLLARLEAASRSVDGFCDRGPSGFGPRTGTNRYVACSDVRLDDDLLTISAIAAISDSGSSTAVTTGYHTEPLGRLPARSLVATSADFGGYWLDVTGTWGYSNVTETLVADVASGLASDATALVFTATADPDIAPGDTILIESEQLYVRAVDGTTVTVKRGQNGTTAATHANGSAIAVYRYPPEVVDATCQVAARRMRQRDAGLTGDTGFNGFVTVQRDTEKSLLRSVVGHLRLYHA